MILDSWSWDCPGANNSCSLPRQHCTHTKVIKLKFTFTWPCFEESWCLDFLSFPRLSTKVLPSFSLCVLSDTLNTYWNKINPQDIMNFLSLLEWVWSCVVLMHHVFLLSLHISSLAGSACFSFATLEKETLAGKVGKPWHKAGRVGHKNCCCMRNPAGVTIKGWQYKVNIKRRSRTQ